MTHSNPKLRWPIDIRRHQTESDNLIILTCPIGITEKPLVLISAVGPILNALDGRKSTPELTQDFLRFGATESLVQELLTLLDNSFFLENDRFFSAKQRLQEDFTASPVRPAALAGITYPNNPQELAREVDSYINHQSSVETISTASPLACLVSPHIDYRRGGSCYGKAYRYLKGDEANIYILIGTSHQYSEHLFQLTKKDFLSPLGPLPCDRDFVENLARQYGEKRSFADEILHRKEHSLELQVPFISRTKPGATIVPILVGGFHSMVQAGRLPDENPLYDQFAAALCESIKLATKKGKTVTFIAGVDMAHVGRNFGDKESLSPKFLEIVRARDLEYLEALRLRDKKKLFEHIASDNDARRICGFPTMYTILDVAERLQWNLGCQVFDYQQAVDYPSDCAVTFAALGLYHAPPAGH